jgi:hypothetical protein
VVTHLVQQHGCGVFCAAVLHLAWTACLFLTEQDFGHCVTRSYIPKILSHTSLSILCPFFLSTMQRSMSYRKPVPTYIPSPPSSPRQSPPNLDLEVPPVRFFFPSSFWDLIIIYSYHPIGVRFWTKLECLRGRMLNHVSYYQQSLGSTSKRT